MTPLPILQRQSYFVVGTQYNAFVTQTGRLRFSVADFNVNDNANDAFSVQVRYVPPMCVRTVPATASMCINSGGAGCADFDTGLDVAAGGWITVPQMPGIFWHYSTTVRTDGNGYIPETGAPVGYVVLPGGISVRIGTLMMRIVHPQADSSIVIGQNPRPASELADYVVAQSRAVLTSGRLTLSYAGLDNVNKSGVMIVGVIYRLVSGRFLSLVRILVSCLPDFVLLALPQSTRHVSPIWMLNSAWQSFTPHVASDLALPITPASYHVLQICIVAQDGFTSTTYTVRIVRTDDVLSSLTFSAGALKPAFSPSVQSYVLSVPYNPPSITLTATRPTVSGPVIVDGKWNSIDYFQLGGAQDYDTGVDVRAGGWLTITTDPLATISTSPGQAVHCRWMGHPRIYAEFGCKRCSSRIFTGCGASRFADRQNRCVWSSTE